MAGNNPFGFFPPAPPIFDMDINPNDFHTRVFARRKTETVVKNRFFKASVNNRFFHISRESKEPEPQLPDRVDLNIVKHNVEQQRSKKRQVEGLVNKHVLVSKKDRQRFTSNFECNTAKIRAFLVEELATHAFAYDSAINEAADILKEITSSEVAASTASVDNMFNLALDVKAFLFIAQNLSLPQQYVDMIIGKMLDQKLQRVKKTKL